MTIHKHIDFQVPGWGEFLAGPVPGVNSLLTQSGSASFPDRPSEGGVGLLVSMSVGGEGSYLSHDLGAEQSVLHVRLLLNAQDVSGGAVTLLAGLDGADVECMRVTLNATGGDLAVWFLGGTTLSAAIDPGLSWHCVEMAVDTVADQADLWINGVAADKASADLSGSTIQTVQLGAVQKDTNTVGELYLDELILADSYVGPVVVEPGEPHAGDPARWLVVYNSADPDAGAWAEAYRTARGIPFANLAGLALPLTEMINTSQYTDLVAAVDDYLSLNQLDGQVVGLLLGYRVPGYIDSVGGGMYESVPAQIQNSSVTLGPGFNTHASPATYERLSATDLAGKRMTARMDAPDLSSAIQLIDRATSINDSHLAASDSLFYFDPFVGDSAFYQAAFNDMIDWIIGEGGMNTRLNIVLSGDPGGNEDAAFDSVSGDGLFWGWSLTLPDPDIFIEPVGRRALCGQVYLGGASATSLRNATPSNWADMPIAAGYAAVVASSRNSPVFWIPDTCALFDAITLEWTLAEAWFIAQPVLRGGFYLVGDPLMRIQMPRTGIEVFGPLDSLQDLDPDSPAAILPENVRAFDLSNVKPLDGTQAVYVVRRTDAQGRSEASLTSVRLERDGTDSLQLPSMPVWPDTAGWRVDAEDDRLRLLACWAELLGRLDVETVELIVQPEGQAEAIGSQPSINPRDDYIHVDLPAPVTRTRYRWRVASTDGVVMDTPCSAYIDPADTPSASLQQIGARY